MVQNGRLINQECTWELNRTVLQRIDHNIEDILISAGHVTLYEFNVDTGQWSRKDVEGSLFVVKRRTKPRFQFIVMNRRSTENLVEDLLDDFEYELQVPYLLYRNAAQEVNGIWFYNCRECEEVANLLSRILNAYSKNPPKRKLFSPPQGDEFRELEAVPTPATVEGPLEPQAMASASGVTKGSLEGFFNIATRLNPHDSVVPSGVKSNASAQVLETPPPPPPPPPPLPVPLPTAQSVIETGITKSMEVPLKPYFFVPPPLPSSQPNTLHPPPLLQPSVGAPLLQPFPPPVPSLSRTPVPFLAGQPVVSREGVRDALFRLVKNDTFIDMVFEEMLKAQGLPA